MTSEHAEDDYYREFVATFSRDCRPNVVWFTGGEPLLRPRLVQELASSCRALGSLTAVTTGLYFGRHGNVPDSIMDVLRTMDLVTISMDQWHQAEVPRAAVMSCIRQLREEGLDVGLQVTVEAVADPALRELRDQVIAEFGGAVEIRVALLGPGGRGADLVAPADVAPDIREPGPPKPQGCGGLSWPVFGFGGEWANACCNQDAIDRRSEHLRLKADWPAMVAALKGDPVLRVINLLGPRVLAHEAGAEQDDPPLPYCYKCHSLAGRPGLAAAAERVVEAPNWPLLEAVGWAMREDVGDPTMSIREIGQVSRGRN